ncbi:MAG: hypothetical protein GY801_22260 [bacterium]|nr:hypothetical protein [bacterium]
MKGKKIYVNGIDGDTGNYLLRPMKYIEAGAFIKSSRQSDEEVDFLRRTWALELALPLDVHAEKVTEAGWAIVFHRDEDEAVKKALEPLIEHRRKQINNDNIVKTLEYQGDDHEIWLANHGVGLGSVEPTKVPYYVLLVGSPERIPFVFGHNLNLEYAVGRLHFDKAEEYSHYAASVIDYETSDTVPHTRDAIFFATRHKCDPATQLSADLLVNPLADGVSAKGGQPGQPRVAEKYGFRTHKIWGNEATKEAFTQMLTPSSDTKLPAFVFTASHGIGWKKMNDKQLTNQGALLCQDFPGFGKIGPEYYFTASDLPQNSRVHGLIAFFFGCYSAGTPAHDRFFHLPDPKEEPSSKVPLPGRIADKPFIAALPKALLTHPKGGALACIGHIDRAWAYSITSPIAGPQLLPFKNAIGRILLGYPVGYALKDFTERYATLSANLADKLQKHIYSPSFKLTNSSFQKLKKERVHNKVIENLKNLKNKVLTEDKLLAAVENQIGAEQAEEYKKLILKHTFYPVWMNEGLARNWIERNDAQSYAVIGDPAVHLRVNDLV